MTADQKKEQFTCAYNDYCDDIFRYCFFRVYNRDLARELVQEVFTKIWKYLVDGKEVQNFRAFAYKVAYHLIVDNGKKKKEKSLDEMMAAGFDQDDNYRNRQQDFIDTFSFIQEVNKLGKKYAEIIKMRYIDDLSIKEISAAVGESENTVYVRIHRGMKQIKENI